MVAMEDISVDGYKTVDRAGGLDMTHVNLAIQKLAKYHAASAYHFEKVGAAYATDNRFIAIINLIRVFSERGVRPSVQVRADQRELDREERPC